MGTDMWRGDQLKDLTRQAVIRGLADAAEHVLAVSKKQVPFREGTLENSGMTEPSADGLTQTLSYNTPYAARQHEELAWRHPVKGKAKYLEDPVNDEQGTVHEIVAASVRRVIR